MPKLTSPRPAEPRENLAKPAAWCKTIEEHLRGRRQALAVEIRNYPTPIPRCDVQFNHLYEQQARLALELNRLAERRRLRRADYIALIERFIASAPYTDDAAERELRSRMKKELSALE